MRAVAPLQDAVIRGSDDSQKMPPDMHKSGELRHEHSLSWRLGTYGAQGPAAGEAGEDGELPLQPQQSLKRVAAIGIFIPLRVAQAVAAVEFVAIAHRGHVPAVGLFPVRLLVDGRGVIKHLVRPFAAVEAVFIAVLIAVRLWIEPELPVNDETVMPVDGGARSFGSLCGGACASAREGQQAPGDQRATDPSGERLPHKSDWMADHDGGMDASVEAADV